MRYCNSRISRISFLCVRLVPEPAPVRPASEFWVTVPSMSGSGHWTSLTSTFLSLNLQAPGSLTPALKLSTNRTNLCMQPLVLVGCMQYIPLNNALPWSAKIAENDWEREYMKPAMSQLTIFYFETLTTRSHNLRTFLGWSLLWKSWKRQTTGSFTTTVRK